MITEANTSEKKEFRITKNKDCKTVNLKGLKWIHMFHLFFSICCVNIGY